MQGYKIIIPNPETSFQVQNKAFELGYSWNPWGKIVAETNRQALYFESDGSISHSNLRFFDNPAITEQEISWQEFLKIGDEEVINQQSNNMSEKTLKLTKAPQKAKNLTVGKDYTGIFTDADDTQVDNKKDAKYFYCVNDAGNEARYAIGLFEETVPARPARPVYPTYQQVIDALSIDQDEVIIKLPGRENYYIFEDGQHILEEDGVNCSCGIYSLNGLNNLKQNIDDYEFPAEIFGEFTAEQIDDFKKILFKKIVLESMDQVTARFYLLSTQSSNNWIVALMDELVEETNGVSTVSAVNPNSHNQIIAWILQKA